MSKEPYGFGQYGAIQFGAALAGPHTKIGSIAPIDAVNLAYISAPKPLPLDSLELVSDINNYALNVNGGIYGNLEDNVVVPTDNVILTHKYYTDSQGRQYPLWYKYESRYLTKIPTSFTVSSLVELASIEQDGGGPLPPGHYYTIELVDSDLAGYYYLRIYANFKGNFDVLYKLVYNRYNDDGAVIAGLRYKETINFVPAYKQVGYFPEESSSEVYYAERTEGGWVVYVSSSVERSNVYLLVESGKQVFLDFPETYSTKEPWYIRIHRGCLSDGSRKLSGYYNQPFESYLPVIRIRKEKAFVVGEKVIRVVHTPIVLDRDKPVDVYINDTCITRTGGADPLESPTSTVVKGALADIVGDRGTIELGAAYSLSDVDEVFVNYYYFEYYYPYRGFVDKTGQFIHLDLNPNAGHTYNDIFTVSRVENEDGTVFTVPQGGVARPTVDLLGKSVFFYWRPDGSVFHVIVDLSDTSDATGVMAGPLAEDLALYFPYTSDVFTDTVAVSGQTVLIGSVHIKPDLPTPIVLDTRSLGGGLRDGVNIKSRDELWWDTVAWDGAPFPINGVTLLDASTVKFDKEFILAQADLFKALGTAVLLSNRTGIIEPSDNSPYL